MKHHFLADQPGMTPESIGRLLDAVQENPLTACLSSGERSRNLTLFSEVLADELCAPEELTDVDVRGENSPGKQEV